MRHPDPSNGIGHAHHADPPDNRPEDVWRAPVCVDAEDDASETPNSEVDLSVRASEGVAECPGAASAPLFSTRCAGSSASSLKGVGQGPCELFAVQRPAPTLDDVQETRRALRPARWGVSTQHGEFLHEVPFGGVDRERPEREGCPGLPRGGRSGG